MVVGLDLCNDVNVTRQSGDDVIALTGNASHRLLQLCSNATVGLQGGRRIDGLTIALVTIYGIICTAGLVGNCLVVFVVARYARMKTVTNVYIMNLSVADGLFLVGLPLIMTTAVLQYWVFGSVMCKIYYALTCINMFTGAFTLTLMSADRFVAVWYPIKSLKYRKPMFAGVEAALTWILSMAVMFPIVLFADIVPKGPGSDLSSCVVRWPAAHALTAVRIYVIYTLIIGFLFPVTFISLFYGLLVSRLRANRHHIRAAERRRRLQRRNVTGLVTLVIGVFFICWLPYWSFQVHLVFGFVAPLAKWKVYLFQFLTILTYANSAINPVLYAYTNDNFKAAFAAAFRCTVDPLRPPSAAESRSYQSNAVLGCSASASASAAVATTAVCRNRVFDGAAGRATRCQMRRRSQRRKHLTVEYEFSVLRTSVSTQATASTCHAQRTTMRRVSNEAIVLLADNGVCLHRMSTGNQQVETGGQQVATLGRLNIGRQQVALGDVETGGEQVATLGRMNIGRQQVALGHMETGGEQVALCLTNRYAAAETGQEGIDVHEPSSRLSPVAEKTLP